MLIYFVLIILVLFVFYDELFILRDKIVESAKQTKLYHKNQLDAIHILATMGVILTGPIILVIIIVGALIQGRRKK